MVPIHICKVDCWGETLYRVISESGIPFMGAIQTDFGSLDDAIAATRNEARRSRMNVQIELYEHGRRTQVLPT